MNKFKFLSSAVMAAFFAFSLASCEKEDFKTDVDIDVPEVEIPEVDVPDGYKPGDAVIVIQPTVWASIDGVITNVTAASKITYNGNENFSYTVNADKGISAMTVEIAASYDLTVGEETKTLTAAATVNIPALSAGQVVSFSPSLFVSYMSEEKPGGDTPGGDTPGGDQPGGEDPDDPDQPGGEDPDDPDQPGGEDPDDPDQPGGDTPSGPTISYELQYVDATTDEDANITFVHFDVKNDSYYYIPYTSVKSGDKTAQGVKEAELKGIPAQDMNEVKAQATKYENALKETMNEETYTEKELVYESDFTAYARTIRELWFTKTEGKKVWKVYKAWSNGVNEEIGTIEIQYIDYEEGEAKSFNMDENGHAAGHGHGLGHGHGHGADHGHGASNAGGGIVYGI